MSIASNLQDIQGRIRSAALSAGREPVSVRLVAVSKTRPAADVIQACQAGQSVFGENYVQELVAKAAEVPETVEWHFIGHLQSNKVRQIAGLVTMIHSVDRLSLAEEVSRQWGRLGRCCDILIQVNISGETTKSGTTEAEALQLVRAVATLPHVRIRGLMTMPPFFDDPEAARPYFAELTRLAQWIGAEGVTGVEMRELSMGMSGDFEAAIQEGATLVRVGTSIFGGALTMAAQQSQVARSKLLRIALLSLASLLLAALTLAPLFSTFELKAYDLLSRLFNPDKGYSEIVIVQVDQASLDSLAAEGVTWPWPRQVYAPLFERLAQADAVFVDIIFSEPSSYGNEDDAILAASFAQSGNVFLPVFATANERTLDAAGQAFLDRLAVRDARKPSASLPFAITPIAPLASAAHGGGNVMIKPDRDGVYRRLPLLSQAAGRTLPHFVLGYLLERKIITFNQGGLQREGVPLPLDEGALLVRFPRGVRPYETVPAVDLISEAGAVRYPASWFKGKKVFLGLTAAGLYDLKPTAVSPVTSGVSVHAATLDALLHGGYFQRVPLAAVVLFMAGIVLVVCGFVLTHSSMLANFVLLLAVALAAFGLPAVLFIQGWYLALLPPLAALVTSFAVASIYSYATEGRERRFVRRAFSQYMDETVVAHLLKNPDLIKPGGQRRRVTVFFADIAGFTTLAEQFPPEETALMLHDVLNAVSEEVIRHRGVIDKYIGDCVMAFWGAPLESPDAAGNACRAALASLAALEQVNLGFKERGLGAISMRVGLHTGDAIVGNLGSDRLFDYTVVGDTVNLASRLESANKYFATRIMLSEETLRDAGDGFVVRELGLIAVKGKVHPMRIYELLAEAGSAPAELLPWAEQYRRAMELFHRREWQLAEEIFEALLRQRPQDGPAARYRDWCRDCLQSSPLTDDWNVIHMTEK